MTSPWNDPPPEAGPPPQGGPRFGGGPGAAGGQQQWGGPGAGDGPPGPPAFGGAGGYAPAPYGYPGAPALTVSPPRPGPLRTAVVLMWIGAGLALLNMLSTFLFVDDIRTEVEAQLRANGQRVTDSTIDAAVTIGIVAAVASGLIAVALWSWMAVKNGQGRSWARVTATVLGGIGILFSALGLVGSGIGAESTPLSVGSSAVNLLLAIAALITLWNKANAAYFAANS